MGGNVCGCMKGHKDECYVDPSKAPLSPTSKELRGRRYFQRRKSRKLVECQPDDNERNQREIEKTLKDQGVFVKVPLVRTGRRPSTAQSERDKNRLTIKENLYKFTQASKLIARRDRLLEKKLLQRQLRRTVSFGAVEHLLRTLRRHDSRRSSADHQWDDIHGVSRIIHGIQVGKKRRRAYTSSSASFSHTSLDTIQKKATFFNEHKISDIHVTGESEDMTAKERLLLWSQQMTEGYVGVCCDNFTTSWKDGKLFNAIIHKYRPDLVDMSKVSSQSSRSNLEHAFTVAEQLGVARLLDPEDVDVTTPDEKSVITYVSTLYDVFPKVPEGVEGISANDVDVKWVEYQNMVNYLSQWIKHNVTVMSDRNFPCNPVELKALYLQYLHFKESEIPLKENEKSKIKHLYKMLEVWIEFGRIHLPEGYHPNDVEKEWGKLIVAMLEREKSLRPEVDRLEMLQQISDRVKRDCVAGEDKLVLARASLQSDIKRLESGIQLQNEPEIAGYLLECENLLRQQVVDIQILLDGKFYLADLLVQRVSKLRDDLLTLRTECSSVYSKGRSLSTEQTKMMISGITQSLNSGFSQNLNMGLSPALTPGSALSSSFTPAMTPGLTPGLTPAMTPGLTPGLIPGLQPTLGVGGSMEPGILQHMKHMQIRKPMLKSSLVDPSLSEEEVNMKFVQDLLNWVEEMQVQLDQGEWGSDLPSVESHLENHKNVHRAVEDFQLSVKEAQMSEIQMTHPMKQSYSDKLSILESQYGRLLNFSKERQKHLDSLHNFVSRATQELIWLNEKEEEEVAFDWSERNSNISRKKDYHAELMRELDEKEGVIKSVQDQADMLLQQNHPARLTIEAYKAAMQTQWSWILQLCYCVEQHLKENITYFEFFNDAKESMDYLKSIQDSITRKYGCDRTSSLHRLEDLIQESMDEKEQLLQYRSTVAGLVGRAKSIVQLKPRNPENPVRTSLPVKAICDYRQIEITIYKDDECVLANNTHRAKWKVISPSGNEAMVPSVCFSVPPPNKDAAELASRIEQLYQKVLALWHSAHVNMKSVVSWHYLMLDIRNIRKSTVASIKTMLPGEHQQVLSSLQSHFEEFLEDSEESEVFTMADCTQLEREMLASKEHYEELLKSAEREEQEESVYNLFITELRNFRMRVEAHEEQLIRQIRSPLERDDPKAIMQRIIDQERKKAELDHLQEDLEVLKEKCEAFLRQAANSPSVPALSSELNVLTQSMAQVYSMCSIYLEKLKTVNLVVKHTQGAEGLVKLYEGKLCEEDSVSGDVRSIDAVMSILKQWRSEIDERRDVFHDLEDELQKARAISDRMFKTHNERDFDLDWHKEKTEQLVERWRNVHAQIENRLRDLEGISKSLKYYKDAYSSLDEWSKEMEVNQLKTQENQPEDSKALAELLNQQKVLVAEIERKQSKIEECQKYSEQYSSGLKDYELQLMTYRAMVDSQHKSPVKRRRMQSSSDTIQQEFMDLRTRYTALVTLMTQYVKFASETLKRAEEDERKTCVDKAEYRSWVDNMESQKVASDEEKSKLKRQVLELEAYLSDRQQQLDILGGEIEVQKRCNEELNVQKTKAEYEAQQFRVELEGAIRAKAAIEQELKNSRQIIQQAEAKQQSLEESLRMLRKNIEESTLARRKLEDHLRRKDNDVQGLEEHRRLLERELKAKSGAEANLLNQVRTMEMDLTQKSEAKLVHGETRKEVIQKSTISISAPEAEALQFTVEELTMGKLKAETEIKTLKSELNSVLMQKNMADEKAQRFKELLDDANNRLKKVQMEIESDRNSIRQKSDELRQETTELRKSVYLLQEQVKSLQRDKSSLEHRVLFHKTEVDGLKEQLNISQGKLVQWSSSEQENCQKLRGLEEELSAKQAEREQLKFKLNELNKINQLLEGDVRHLTVSIESFQQEKSHFEQQIQTLKNESKSVREQLQNAIEQVNGKTRIEKDLQLKLKNLELELQKNDLQVTQLTKKLEELRKTVSDNDRSVKNLNAEIDKANMEIGSKDQQINIFKSQAESTKSQLKIIEDELLKKTQNSHELQLKLRDYNEEVKKTSELQQKVKTLNAAITNYETDVRNLNAELTAMSLEKNLANQRAQEHKAEINNLNMTLQQAKAEAQKESSEAKKNVAKLREIENELIRCRQTISQMTGTSEKTTVNLKLDISTLQREKQAADQKLQALKTEFNELNSTLKKTKDELLRVTQEGKINHSKIKDLEAELQKNRMVIREINSNSDKHSTQLQQDCSNLLKERGIAQEKIGTLMSEISQLKIKLDHTQDDLMQKQKETAAAQKRSQMLEEQLENCKRMLEDLKGKLELQKKGYETQLQLMQNEMEQKLALQESRMKLECDRKSKERMQSVETIERHNQQLLQEIEKLKTLHLNAMKAKQEAQKQVDSMSSQLDQCKKQKGALDLELMKSKSKITELETEKIRVKSSISQLDNIRKENSEETVKLKQMLSESKQKLMMAENEAKASKDQIASYIQEVKSLQEKNLKLEVTYSSEMKRLKVLEGENHQCVKDGEIAKLKTELILKQKLLSSYEEAKRKEDLQKMTSEVDTLKEDKVMEELKLKQNKMVPLDQTCHDLRITENSHFNSNQNQLSMLSTSNQRNLDEHTYTSMKSSLLDKGKYGAKNQSVTFNITTTELFDEDSSESSMMSKQPGSGLLKLQGLRGRVSIKKLIKTRIITEEIASGLKTGLISMDEVQASLAQFTGKPVSIAGIYIESSKNKVSFMDAAETGIMARTYAIEFLEAQAATGAIIDPITGESYSASDAFDKGIIGGEIRERITDAEKAVSGYPHGGKLLSVFQAMEERILDRHRAKGILEAQIATGGLIHPLVGMRVPPESAIEQGLINQATLQTLFDPITNPKSFHNPETGQRAYYYELLKLCVYDVNGGVYLLPYGNDHISSFTPASTHKVSVIDSSTGTEMSTYEAYKAKLIDKRIYLFLSQQESEWQEKNIVDSSGTTLHILTDLKSGRQFCIENALCQKILQISELQSYRSGQISICELADLLIFRQVVVKNKHSPIAGLWDVTFKKRLSVLKGLQQNLVDRLTALKLLEAQACTGGICDPSSGDRFQIVDALHHGLLDESFARPLQQFDQAYYGIIQQQTGKKLSVGQAMRENLFPKDIGLRCLEYQLATGGLIDPESQNRVSLEDGIKRCLIDKATAAQLRDDHLLNKTITCPKTKRKISFKEALEKGKSVEEERKEHGDKVSTLLNWMSEVKSDVNKNKSVGDDRGSTESSIKPQISMEEVLSKKEQITEAIRSTQMMLNKHGDKMSEKEKREAKEQLKLLRQAHSEVSHMSVNQPSSAEQDFQVIEGILDVEKDAVLSVCRAVQTGLIDHCTGLGLLEVQLVTTELILPEFHMCLDLADAFKHNLVDKTMYKQLQVLNEANKCIQSPRYASEPLPAVAAMMDGAISERLAVKIIEIQLAAGGLRVTYAGESLNLKRAFEFGLIPQSLYIQILERQNSGKDLIDPNTAEKVSLIQLVQRSVVHEKTGLRLLLVKSGNDRCIVLAPGKEVNLLTATHEGLMDREIVLRLLSAQLFAGGIIDPRTNCKLTVEEAVCEGLIDHDTASGILSHQAQNGGIVNPKTGARLTVDEAVQCDLISSRSALLVLERQKCFTGLLWPQSGEILSVSQAIQHEIITEELAHEIISNRHKIAAFYIPENSEVVDIYSAAQNGFIDACTVDFLKTIQIPDMFPDVDELNNRFSSWLVMQELQIEACERSSKGLEANEKSTNAPSSVEAEQLFVSFLMLNSYMDPKSGQRLQIFDRQLNKMAKVLLKVSEIDMHSNIHDWPVDEDISDDTHITHAAELSVLHINEPSIEEECVSDMSTDDCLNTFTSESDSLTLGSGQVFNNSASENKISEGLNEDRSRDITPTNKTVHSSGTDNLAKLHSDVLNQTNLLAEGEKYAYLDYVENLISTSDKDATQCSVVLHSPKDQTKEGDIPDVMSEKQYNLNDVFDKDLVNEKTMSVLKQATSPSYVSSHGTLENTQKQYLLSGFCDTCGKSISAGETLQIGLITDPERKCVCSESRAKTVCYNAAGVVMSEVPYLDFTETSNLRSSLGNEDIIAEELGGMCLNTKNLPAQKSVELDSAIMLRKPGDNEIASQVKDGSVKIFNENIPSAENAVKCPDKITRLLATATELTGNLDSMLNSKIDNAEELDEKCTSSQYGLISAADSIALLTGLTQFTKSSESSLKTVTGEGMTDKEFDESLKCENEVKKTNKSSDLEATTSTQRTYSSDTSYTLNALNKIDISDEDIGDEGLKPETQMKTLEEDSYLSVDVAQISRCFEEKSSNTENAFDKSDDKQSELATSSSLIIAVEKEKLGFPGVDIKGKCPSADSEVNTTEKYTDLPGNSQQMARSLESQLTLNASSEENTIAKVVDKSRKDTNLIISEKLTASDRITAGEFAEIRFNNKGEILEKSPQPLLNVTQMPSNSDSQFLPVSDVTTEGVGTEIEIKRTEQNNPLLTNLLIAGEKCPSSESTMTSTNEVSEGLTTSAQTANNLNSSFTLKTAADEISAGEFGETCQNTENEMKISEEANDTAQNESSSDSSFTQKTEIPVEKCPDTDSAVKRTDAVTSSLRSGMLKSSFTSRTDSEQITDDAIEDEIPSTKNAVKRTEEVIRSLESSCSLKRIGKITDGTFVEKCPSTDNAVKSTDEDSSLLSSSSLASSFTLKTDSEEITEKPTSNQISLRTTLEGTNVTQMASSLDQFTFLRDVESPALKFTQTSPGNVNAVKVTNSPLTTTRDSSFTIKTENENTVNRPEKNVTQLKPSTEISSSDSSLPLKTDVNVSTNPFSKNSKNEERTSDESSLPNVTHTTCNLYSSSTFMADRDHPAETFSEKCRCTENAVNKNRETNPLLTTSTQIHDTLHSSFSLQTVGEESTDSELGENCLRTDGVVNRTDSDTPLISSDSSFILKRHSDENVNEFLDDECLSTETEVKRTKQSNCTENALNRTEEATTEMKSSLNFSPAGEEITEKQLSEGCPGTDDFKKKTAVNSYVLPNTTLMTSLNTTGCNISLDDSNSVKQDKHIIYTSDLGNLDISDCLDTKNPKDYAELENLPERDNQSLCQSPLAAVKDVAPNKVAGNEPRTSDESNYVKPSSLQNDLYFDQNIRACVSPESNENLQDQKDGVSSQLLDSSIHENISGEDPNRTDHLCMSGTVNDHATVKAVETQSSVDSKSVRIKSMDMSQLGCGDTSKTSPTVELLPAVTLSDDSDMLPDSSLVITKKSECYSGTSEYKTSIEEEQFLKCLKSKPTFSSNSSHSDSYNVHTPQASNNLRHDEDVCVNPLLTETEFPSVYINELEQAVTELQSEDTHAPDSMFHISSSAAQHDLITQGFDECKDLSLLKGLREHEEILPGCVTQEPLPSGVSGHDQSQLQKMIPQMSAHKEMLKETSAQGDEGSFKKAIETKLDDDLDNDVFRSAWSRRQSSEAEISTMKDVEKAKFRPRHYLECVGKLQDHYDALEDIRNDVLSQGPSATHIEALQDQLETARSLEAHLTAFPGILTSDMEVAEQLLESADELIPTQVQQDLATVFVDLQAVFADVCRLSSERHNAILQAVDAAKENLECTYEDLLSSLKKLSTSIKDYFDMLYMFEITKTDDLETVKYKIQQNKDLQKTLSVTRQNLEDAAFDIQNYISEHAQFLTPAQNRHMLKSLSTTQRAFKELVDHLLNQRQTLDLHLEIREDEIRQQNAMEKQKEFVAKLQDLCDDLTQTENRLISQQQQSSSAKSVGDLQQYQQENQALQKDIQDNASALNEVISSTKKFLEENRSTLTPEQVAAVELKLEEVKRKANMLNQKAEETRKELDKVVTTVIKQETEKVAAVEQLEETKNKIEVLLDWVSNIGKDKEVGGISKENGNILVDEKIKEREDDPNGNALDSTDSTMQTSSEDTKELDINEQYKRLKDHHQEILSQQQDLVIATQSAQSLLDKQANVLSPSEKEKLQKDIQDLRRRYEASLTQSEQQIKQMQNVQEELCKFHGDYEEFGVWMQQAQEQLAELGAPTDCLDVLQEKLQSQKSFYEDMISHKGDLRFITISGQKVLDAANACTRSDSKEKQGLMKVDTSGTCAAVKEKLDSIATQYKDMHTQCNQLGNNLKDVVDKFKKYEDATSGLLSWLDISEAEARRQQSERIAADPQTLQRQLEETKAWEKALQGQTTGHQVALETLRKTADALITGEGDLLTNKDELQEAVDDIVERYDNLSKSVSDRNEKLQVTLTRSLSVQDGLDEMMNWMKKVEESVEEASQVLLDSASIADALSKQAALEQDMSSRQSSISTMRDKVKKFVETAEPAAAAALQAKMEGLTQRFDDACKKHKQKVSHMEQLKDKVEEFERTSEKVQEFVLKQSHALCETDGPGKNVKEFSQLLQAINAELAEHTKDMETLQLLSKELSNSGPEGGTALIQGKMANLSNTFNTFKDTVKEKEDEVLSCQDQLGEFKAVAEVLMKWLEETKEQVPVVQPNCSEQGLGNDVKKVNGLLEEWSAKAPAVQDINSKGSALCTLISVLTTPAKAKMHHISGSAVSNGLGPGGSYLTNKELTLVQQNISCINEDYTSLGELLKTRSSELSALLLKVQGVQDQAQSTLQWLENMKKTAVSWNSEPAGKESMKMQLEQQKAYEENINGKQQQYQELRKKLLQLIEESPDSPEAEKWKNMLKQMDAGWEEVKGSVENRKQHLEESSRMLELFQSNHPQLSQWLQEKDLMMSVLGPLSMDPNMLNTQKQQVQILLKEFEGRKPQYDQLIEAATVISTASANEDPVVKKVKEQLDSITQKWKDLTHQLSARDALIQQAAGKTAQFQDLLQQLGESAADLEFQLNGQQTFSTQPDAVKKQLEATNAVLAKLCEEKKRLKEAENLCSELSTLVTEEYLRASLSAQMESVSKPIKMLEDKAGKRIQQLTSTFASSQEFYRTSKDFQGWIEQRLKEQAGPQSISTKQETLLQSLKEHSVIQSTLSKQEEQYNNIMREADALLQNTEGEEKLALQAQLSALRSNWEEVKRGATERAEKLNVAMERAKKYKEHTESLGTWLQECEDRKSKANFSVNPVEVENSLSQIKAVQQDVDKHRGQMELLNIAADSLLEVAMADVDDVKDEKVTIGKNMDKLTEELQLKKETLEKLSQKLKEFSDTHKELSGQMEGAKKHLEYHSGLGIQGCSNKNLANMKAQQKNLKGVQNQIENLKNLAQGLVVDAPDVEGVVDLLLQTDTLEKEHNLVSKAIEDECSTLENKLQGIGQFQDSIRETFTTFADLDDELDGMDPIARDLKTLQQQQEVIRNFVTKLQDLIINTASARENCKKLLESEVSPDLLGLKRDLEALSKQSGKLMDRATRRKDQVEETLKHLQEFYCKLDTFTKQLTGAEEKEESQGPVGMETEFINQQLEAFQKVRLAEKS
ncbi:Dystonin [Bagarius yarrelli]|uniref:Dystonin n=1 Tax=Bagarius yarrelli TaxID=175774 RepID=A0A556U740_BAGYA|nr:Dystonin [Bagarius yarrelli]